MSAYIFPTCVCVSSYPRLPPASMEDSGLIRMMIAGPVIILFLSAFIVLLPGAALSQGRETNSETITLGGSVSNSTIINTVNRQDPAVLAAMAKTFADQMAATTEARAKAEAKAAELATQLGLTSTALTEFFRILGEQNVPPEQMPKKLVDIAIKYKQDARTSYHALWLRYWAWIKLAPVWLQLSVALALAIMLWSSFLLGIWILAPWLLVKLYEKLPGQKVIDELADLTAKPTMGLSKLLRLIGSAALIRLGTSRRALDGWVGRAASEVRDRFSRLKVVQERQIALNLPAKLNGSTLEQPWSALDALFRKHTTSLLIVGPGGSGKTTLALRIARHCLGEEGAPLGGHLCLPLLIDRDLEATEASDGLLVHMAGALRAMAGLPRLSIGLGEALLRSGRVMVIADGLSERSQATRHLLDPGRLNFPIMRFIVTSRSAEQGNVDSVLETLTIPPDALYSFIASYVDAMSKSDPSICLSDADILEACAGLIRLLRTTPTTPLFASMWAEEIGRSGQAAARAIHSVAELIDSYVDRLLSPVAGDNAMRLDGLRLDLVAIADEELRESLTPGWLTRAQVLGVLCERAEENPDERIRVLLESKLLETDSFKPELMRISMDTIAEHLVAREKMEELAGDIKKWQSFLSDLDAQGRPAGFRDALRACIDHRAYGRSVPNVIRNMLQADQIRVTSAA